MAVVFIWSKKNNIGLSVRKHFIFQYFSKMKCFLNYLLIFLIKIKINIKNTIKKQFLLLIIKFDHKKKQFLLLISKFDHQKTKKYNDNNASDND